MNEVTRHTAHIRKLRIGSTDYYTWLPAGHKLTADQVWVEEGSAVLASWTAKEVVGAEKRLDELSKRLDSPRDLTWPVDDD